MTATVTLQAVEPRTLAVVRRELVPGHVGDAWGPALDLVWQHIRSVPGLWAGGHNVFVYHHPAQPGDLMVAEFGVEVTRTVDPAGAVHPSMTPAGEAAVAVHRGPYNRMNEAYDAIAAWMTENGRESAGVSWEIYGDATPDPAETETTIVFLLR